MHYIIYNDLEGYGVPTNDVLFADEAVNCPATPKSHNWTFPSAVSNIFAAIKNDDNNKS